MWRKIRQAVSYRMFSDRRIIFVGLIVLWLVFALIVLPALYNPAYHVREAIQNCERLESDLPGSDYGIFDQRQDALKAIVQAHQALLRLQESEQAKE